MCVCYVLYYGVVSPPESCGNQSARDITEFCSVNMDVWYSIISVVCDIVE